MLVNTQILYTVEFWLQKSKKNTNQLYVFFFPNDSRMDKGFLEAWKWKIIWYSVGAEHAQTQDTKEKGGVFL